VIRIFGIAFFSIELVFKSYLWNSEFFVLNLMFQWFSCDSFAEKSFFPISSGLNFSVDLFSTLLSLKFGRKVGLGNASFL
jgi:hypothetical protein